MLIKKEINAIKEKLYCLKSQEIVRNPPLPLLQWFFNPMIENHKTSESTIQSKYQLFFDT